MKPIIHGGEILRAAEVLGLLPESILDFSASINPLGMPSEAKAAAYRGVDLSQHYPEVHASSLRKSLAAYHGIPEKLILPGAGATDLLYRLFRTLGIQRALVVRPAFGEYTRAIEIAGGAIDSFDLRPETHFTWDLEAFMNALSPRIDWVVLANPGNPSGIGISSSELGGLVNALPPTVRILVDESFVDFCPQLSLLPDQAGKEKLFILRSLTKFYALAGLRVGYLVGPPDDLFMMARQCEPWTVCSPGQEAARVCLLQKEYARETLTKITLWRASLAADLAALGMKIFPSVANYLLVRLGEGMEGRALRDALFARGILVRTCGSFPPLHDDFLRIAVRSEPENQRLVAALADLLQHG